MGAADNNQPSNTYYTPYGRVTLEKNADGRYYDDGPAFNDALGWSGLAELIGAKRRRPPCCWWWVFGWKWVTLGTKQK